MRQPLLQPCSLSSGDVLSCRVRCGALKWTRVRASAACYAVVMANEPLSTRNVRAHGTAAAGDRFGLLATSPELSERAETGDSCIHTFGWVATLPPHLLCGPTGTAASRHAHAAPVHRTAAFAAPHRGA